MPKFEKAPSLEETLEKAKGFLEKAKTSTGRDRADAVFECWGIFMDAGLGPEDFQKIGITYEKTQDLVHQADKEEAREWLEKARSSQGLERIDAVERCKFMLDIEPTKKEKIITPEDIGTTIRELDDLMSQGEEEKL